LEILKHLPELKKRLVAIRDPHIRKQVAYFLMQFEKNVNPEIPDLRKSIVHNDANDWNVLAADNQVSGIIDFGDMVYSPLINELAVAATYILFDKSNPLEWAATLLKAYVSEVPLHENEVDLLYWLIAGRVCLSLIMSAESEGSEDDNSYQLVSRDQSVDLLDKWFQINPTWARTVFREAAGLPIQETESVAEKLENRFRHISSAQSVSYSNPIRMTGAAFQYMYDAYGNTFLDAYNNIPHVGHTHPKVVEAGHYQMASLNTNTRYLYDELSNYAEKLLSRFPDSLNKVFFVNSGSAASDLAIRMAQTHTGNRNVMVLEHGYHGHTRLGVDISHYKFGSKGGRGQAEYILKAPIPDTFRGEFRNDDGSAGKQYALKAGKILNQVDQPIAAFIAEPIVGCAGQVPLAKDYLKHIYPMIRKAGGVCISDEVQTGFGRLGSKFWGYELQEVIPDIVVLGKPMGNGHPIGAVVTTDSIAQSFDNGMEFFSSFGGNPVSCAIGMAVLDVIEEENLQNNAEKTGSYLVDLLNQLRTEFNFIGDVRGHGLFIGVELVKDRQTLEHHTELAKIVKNEMREKHILISTDGQFDNILKMKPPLCFSQKNADQVVEILHSIFRSV